MAETRFAWIAIDMPSIAKIPVQHHTGDLVLFYTGSFFSPRVLGIDASRGESSDENNLHEVRIIDNDYNTYREVMDITMLALGISEEQAFAVAWEVDHRGSCVVAVGPYPEAELVAKMIRTIGIEVQVNAVGGGSA
jgi:ATP-dependent Clp protease adapter protein ClpS